MGFRSLREFLDFFGFGFDLHDSDEMDHSAVVPLFIDRQRRLGPGPVACRPHTVPQSNFDSHHFTLSP